MSNSNPLGWFDINNYPESNDKTYWKAMISSRIKLGEYLQIVKETNSTTQNRFDNVIKETKVLAKEPESAHASWIRGVPDMRKLPTSVALMRFSDLERLSSWARFSADYQSDLNKIHKYEEIAWVANPDDHDKNDRPDVDIANVRREYEEQQNTTLTHYSGWENLHETPGYSPMMINLNQPIETIISDIKAIKKSAMGTRKFLKDWNAEFEKWHKYGLLPYCDLKLWSKINRKRLTNEQMNKSVFISGLYPIGSIKN